MGYAPGWAATLAARPPKRAMVSPLVACYVKACLRRFPPQRCLPGVPAMEIQIRNVAANGFEFRCRVCGDRGEPVILLHGFPATSCMWTELLPRLAGNFEVDAEMSGSIRNDSWSK